MFVFQSKICAKNISVVVVVLFYLFFDSGRFSCEFAQRQRANSTTNRRRQQQQQLPANCSAARWQTSNLIAMLLRAARMRNAAAAATAATVALTKWRARRLHKLPWAIRVENTRSLASLTDRCKLKGRGSYKQLLLMCRLLTSALVYRQFCAKF